MPKENFVSQRRPWEEVPLSKVDLTEVSDRDLVLDYLDLVLPLTVTESIDASAPVNRGRWLAGRDQATDLLGGEIKHRGIKVFQVVKLEDLDQETLQRLIRYRDLERKLLEEVWWPEGEKEAIEKESRDFWGDWLDQGVIENYQKAR